MQTMWQKFNSIGWNWIERFSTMSAAIANSMLIETIKCRYSPSVFFFVWSVCRGPIAILLRLVELEWCATNYMGVHGTKPCRRLKCYTKYFCWRCCFSNSSLAPHMTFLTFFSSFQSSLSVFLPLTLSCTAYSPNIMRSDKMAAVGSVRCYTHTHTIRCSQQTQQHACLRVCARWHILYVCIGIFFWLCTAQRIDQCLYIYLRYNKMYNFIGFL